MALTPVSFIDVPQNPVPLGAECFNLDTPDGAKLRVATFPLPGETPTRGTILLLSGRSEFIEKYFEVIGELHQRGFSVTTMDWRGQGLSDRLLPIREKGHITNFATFTADLRLLTETVSKPRFAGPRILMTHSMGGVPALQTLAHEHDDYIAAILCAPMTRLFKSRGMRLIARTLSKSAVAIGASRQCIMGVKEYSLEFEGNILTSDADRHARFRALQAAAPNATLGSPTYGWLKAATSAIDEIHDPDYMRNYKTPTLIISAEKDGLIDSTDHGILATNNEHIHVITVKNALHEILMEKDSLRQEYWRAFDQFIDPILS